MVSPRAGEERRPHVISTAPPRSRQREHLFVKSHHKRAAERVRVQTSANARGHVRTAALPTGAQETCSSACFLRAVHEVKLRHSSPTPRCAVSRATLQVWQLLTRAPMSRTAAVEREPALLGKCQCVAFTFFHSQYWAKPRSDRRTYIPAKSAPYFPPALLY